MQSVVIKPFTDQYIDEVVCILKQEIGLQYLEQINEELNSILFGKVKGYVAVKREETATVPKETILGYASWTKKVHMAYLETIAVNSKLQGQGIGRLLMDHVVNDIKQKDPAITQLHVVTDNDAKQAVSFYVRYGFCPSGCVNDEFILGTTQVHLSLKLHQ
jgi:ribosomal protein S18 acetylase RimI-like enzyme